MSTTAFKKGFTLIELIMVISIMGVLAASGTCFLLYLVQNFVFIPNQMNTDMASSDALKIMIEGDGTAKGLRFLRAVSSVADNQTSFINQDGQTVRYRLDSQGRIQRSLNGGAESAVPYYASSGMVFSGKNNRLFTYYDASEVITAAPSSVRRIEIALAAQTGSGVYADWEGRSDAASSITVARFQ